MERRNYMGLIAKADKGFDPVPAGVHQGVCYAIYDLGTQYQKNFDNHAHQCLIIWEIPSERIEIPKDGKILSLPRVVSKTFTISLGKKSNLRKYLESWRGRIFTDEELQGFDISKLIGKNGMVQVIHTSKDGNTYANVSAILPLYKGMQKIEPENPTVVYAFEQGEPPEGTPKWIVEKIHGSTEWTQAHNPVPDEPHYSASDAPDDEIPF
jgi:hypothetical protein